MTNKKMHDDELDITESLVKQLLSAQFPHWANLPISRVKSDGTDNAIYRLGTDMCIRLPRLPDVNNQFQKEQQWLPVLAPQLPLAIPVPLGSGVPSEHYPWHWSINTWLEGRDLASKPISDLSHAAVDLAKFINALQQADTTGAPPSRRGKPLSALNSEFIESINALQGIMDTKAAVAMWEECLAAPVWDKPSVWIHGDLLPANLLAQNGKLSAVIDFGIFGIGDPACDLIPAWCVFTADTRDEFRARLNIDDATWTRGRGWALSIAIIILPYYMHTNPGLVRVAKRILGEIFKS